MQIQIRISNLLFELQTYARVARNCCRPVRSVQRRRFVRIHSLLHPIPIYSIYNLNVNYIRYSMAEYRSSIQPNYHEYLFIFNPWTGHTIVELKQYTG